MKSTFRILNRCLVVEFYKQNAAFFGLFFLIQFGFIKASEHIAIGSFLVSNPITLIFLFAIYFGYGIKVILFVYPGLNKGENQFLEAFYCLSLKHKIYATLSISALLFIPITSYSGFLIILAIPHFFIISMTSLIVFSLILHSTATYLIIKKLNSLPHEKTFLQLRFLNKIAKPPYLFFIEHLIRNDFVLLLLTKTYSGLMIIGVTALYKTDQFDLRLLTTGLLLALVGNVALLHKYIWFYYSRLSFSTNLPQSFLRVSLRHLFTFCIIAVPEVVIVFRHFPLSPSIVDVIGIITFCVSLLSIIYAMLIIKQVELSDFIIHIFLLVVFTTFLILFSIHPVILALFFILISILVMYFRQYKFDFVEKRQ